MKRSSIFTAISAVFKKELKIFLRYPSWFISMLIWPIIFPFGYLFTAKALSGVDGQSLTAFSNISGTSDYISFMLIGTTMWMMMNSMLWSFGTSLRTEQIRGTLESNWLCPVPKITILLGHSLREIFSTVIFLIITAIELKLIYNFKFIGSPLLSFLIIIISIPSIYGIGFIFASLVMWQKETNSTVFLVRGIMSIFCGITYPLTVLPNWMGNISKVIPLTHSISALRSVISTGATLVDIKNQIYYLIFSGIILMALGFLAFNFTQRKVKESGSLGHF